MARKKDLGSLAALAGLAYMASRDKAMKGDVPVEDRTGSATGFMNEKEPGWESKGSEFGTEKEPGWESGTAPARRSAAPATRRAAPSVGGRENARDDILMRQGRVPNNTEEGMRNYAPRRSVAQQLEGRDDTYNPAVGYRTRTENKDTSDLTYKKGGKVKGWGSARGARKAKIY